MGATRDQDCCWTVVLSHPVGRLGVVETESAIALGQLMHAWTDLTVDHVTPVLSEEDVLKLRVISGP
jgi:hypothetical protein